MKTTDLGSQRHLFEIPEGIAYLNCVYMLPQLGEVRRVGEGAVARKSRPWEVSPKDFFEESETARALFAQLAGPGRRGRADHRRGVVCGAIGAVQDHKKKDARNGRRTRDGHDGRATVGLRVARNRLRSGTGRGTGGAVYGAFSVPLFAALQKLIEQEGPRVAASYFVGSMLYGVPVGLVVGGLVIGPLMGLLLGPVNGLFLFAVLRAFPPGRARGPLSSRRVLAWAACLITSALAIAVVCGYVLWEDPYLLSNLWLNTTPGTYGGIKPNEVANLVVMGTGTALIAMLAMRWADGKVVGWYEREVSGAERTPASSVGEGRTEAG